MLVKIVGASLVCIFPKSDNFFSIVEFIPCWFSWVLAVWPFWQVLMKTLFEKRAFSQRCYTLDKERTQLTHATALRLGGSNTPIAFVCSHLVKSTWYSVLVRLPTARESARVCSKYKFTRYNCNVTADGGRNRRTFRLSRRQFSLLPLICT